MGRPDTIEGGVCWCWRTHHSRSRDPMAALVAIGFGSVTGFSTLVAEPFHFTREKTSWE